MNGNSWEMLSTQFAVPAVKEWDFQIDDNLEFAAWWQLVAQPKQEDGWYLNESLIMAEAAGKGCS